MWPLAAAKWRGEFRPPKVEYFARHGLQSKSIFASTKSPSLAADTNLSPEAEQPNEFPIPGLLFFDRDWETSFLAFFLSLNLCKDHVRADGFCLMLEREVGGEFIIEETWLHKLGQLSSYKFSFSFPLKATNWRLSSNCDIKNWVWIQFGKAALALKTKWKEKINERGRNYWIVDTDQERKVIQYK